MEQSFSLHIDIDETLTVDEIWPDGNAPEDPTIEDVRKALFGEAAVKYDTEIGHKLSDLGLGVTARDVWIVKDDMARLERERALIAEQLPAVIEGLARVAKEKKEKGS